MSTPSDKTLRLERTKLTPQGPRGRNNTTLIMALVAGLAAAALAFVFINNQKSQPAPTPVVTAPAAPPKSPVVIATVDIPAQAPLDSTKFQLATVDPAKADPNAVANSTDLVNTIASKPIKAGMQITRDQIAPRVWDFGGMSTMFGPGFRAMTIALDPQTSVGGFLKPGDYVDVLGTFNVGQGRTVTRTVLQNVYLLATGAQVVQATPPPAQNTGLLADKPDNGQDQFTPKPTEIPNATVKVTPVDAEKLMLASSQSQGKLMLILRSKTDMLTPSVPTIDASAVTGVRTASVGGAPPPQPMPVLPAPVPAPIPAPSAPASQQVTVIRGSNPSQVNVPI